MFFNPRLAVIYVEYNPEKYAGAFERVRSYLDMLSQERVVYVVVNNKDEGDKSSALGDRTYYVQGDNVEREFSGWQKGLVFLRRNNIPFDVLLFVNEAFEAEIPSYLRNHSVRWIVFKTYFFRSASGAIDTAWEKIKIRDKNTRAWINTNCFFIPRSLSEKLGTIISIDRDAIDEYLPESFPGSGKIFLDNAPLNDVYKERVVKWLTERWRNRLVLDEKTWPLFRAKAKAMFNEALLSIRIRELGYLILPYSLPVFAFLKARGIYRKVRTIFAGRHHDQVERASLERATHHDHIC